MDHVNLLYDRSMCVSLFPIIHFNARFSFIFSPLLRRLIIYCGVQRFRSLLVAPTITSRAFSGTISFRRASESAKEPPRMTARVLTGWTRSWRTFLRTRRWSKTWKRRSRRRFTSTWNKSIRPWLIASTQITSAKSWGEFHAPFIMEN